MQHRMAMFVSFLLFFVVPSSIFCVIVNNEIRYDPFIDSTITDFGSYDFVIAGASPAGCVLANRLSEQRNFKVLLLEAGDFGGVLTPIPGVTLTTFYSDYNWKYQYEPQDNACLGFKENRCPLVRGRGVGGGTLINAVIYSRGSPEDFNLWSALGNPGWSYEELLPYFKKSQKLNLNDPNVVIEPEVHGTSGPLNLEYFLPRTLQMDMFLQGNLELGFNASDTNGRRRLGVSPALLAIKDHVRIDAGRAFVKPILHRPNLKVLTESYVTRIKFDSSKTRAEGVFFTASGRQFFVGAKKEVIVSSGAIGSPQILLQSGIGPEDHLASLQIPLVRNLQVGGSLRDHVTLRLVLSAEALPTVNQKNKFLQSALDNILGRSAAIAIGFYRTKLEQNPAYTDLELEAQLDWTGPDFLQPLHFKPEVQQALSVNTTKPSFNIIVANLQTHSIGSIRLNSTQNPYSQPIIKANILQDSRDFKRLYEGVKIVQKLVKTPTFRKYGFKLQTPNLPGCQNHKKPSKKYWYCIMKQVAFNEFHPSSTCPMGPSTSSSSVVDSSGLVHGIKNVRVADTSVFPFPISGHPMAPCMMLGEKMADLIKQQNGVHN